MISYKSTYKSTSLDRKRKYLPYFPDDVFGLIMYERNRIMREDEVQELQKRITRYTKLIDELELEYIIMEEAEVEEQEEYEEVENQIDELAESVNKMRRLINELKDPLEHLDEFWLMSRVA